MFSYHDCDTWCPHNDIHTVEYHGQMHLSNFMWYPNIFTWHAGLNRSIGLKIHEVYSCVLNITMHIAECIYSLIRIIVTYVLYVWTNKYVFGFITDTYNIRIATGYYPTSWRVNVHPSKIFMSTLIGDINWAVFIEDQCHDHS